MHLKHVLRTYKCYIIFTLFISNISTLDNLIYEVSSHTEICFLIAVSIHAHAFLLPILNTKSMMVPLKPVTYSSSQNANCDFTFQNKNQNPFNGLYNYEPCILPSLSLLADL